MRRLIAAALILAGAAAPALAQNAAGVPPQGPAAVPSSTLPPAPDEDAPASTVAADLSGLYLRIEQDEAVMTRLRSTELGRENAHLRAIRPALKFKDWLWFPRKY